jgi:hypothetical protein
MFNKKYTKDDYKQEVQNMRNTSYAFEDFQEFALTFPVQNLIINNSENAL